MAALGTSYRHSVFCRSVAVLPATLPRRDDEARALPIYIRVMSMERATQVARADALAIERAARALAQGQLVAFPTETVYGLGADAGNGEAVARLYEAKGRPSFNPLIAHVASADAARMAGI